MPEYNDDIIPLYNSTKDVTPETAKADIFQADDSDLAYVLKEPVTVQQPATVIFATKTVIPTSTQLEPDLAQVPPVPTVQIDVEKIAKYFGEDTGSQIIDDIKNDVALPEKVAEILVSKNIVTQPVPADVAPVKQVVNVPGNPVIGNPVVTEKPMMKKGILDGISNFIYKLLYK